ncbi:LysR family transcriptional regulator [Puniceicoccaceae bacterium K14]|nr:LysR family transcriptional regulator [Puniceicoccaceae bacterium K14]
MFSITHRQIECFLEICRDFHFSNAAKRLGLTQPPLSRNIKELETAIGARLFDRNPKNVRLTPAGTAFLDEIYRLPSLINRAVSSAQRAQNGEHSILKIGFVGALLGFDLLKIIDEFRSSFPKVQLKLIDDSPASLLEQINNDALDGIFLGLMPNKLSPNLNTLVWKKERLLACVPTSHKFANAKHITLKKLAHENLVTLSPQIAPAYSNLIDQLFESFATKPKVVQQTDKVPALLSNVAAGIGTAILPYTAFSQAKSHICGIPIHSSKAKVSNTFVFRKNTRNTQLIELLAILERSN